jgi:uncharacterized protein (TIGR02246 family)
METEAQQIVISTIADLERGWNSASGEIFAEPFADDADFVTIRGEHSRSKIAITRGHQAIFDTIYKGSKVQFQVIAARVIAPGVILGHIKSTLKAPSGPLAGEHNSLASVILVQNAGGWKIASFHNTLMAKG